MNRLITAALLTALIPTTSFANSMKGNSITAFEALQEFGRFSLASRINDLKNDGHVIKSRPIKVHTQRNGAATISEYYL